MIEAKNVKVLKTVFGDDNVTVDASGNVAIKVNSKILKAYAWVFDMLLSDGSAKRTVIPDGQVTNVGAVTYNDSELIGYDTTMTAYPDASGNTHYEYITAS